MQKIIVDMTPGHRMPTIYFSQGDVGTQFAIDLRSRFGDSLPASPTVTIQATKPSGFGFTVSATSLTNGVAVFTTTAEMTDEAGFFPAELKVVKDSVTLFTANFNMAGKATTHPEGTIDGQQETIVPELTQLVERVEDAASSVLDMTVEADTLAAGSQATYSYDEETNTATFGIPQGEAGAGAAGVTANAYSSSATYAVGDYVIHNSNLYRCTTAITTAEAFTAAHWTQVVLADDVSDVKSDLNTVYDAAVFQIELSQLYAMTPFMVDSGETVTVKAKDGSNMTVNQIKFRRANGTEDYWTTSNYAERKITMTEPFVAVYLSGGTAQNIVVSKNGSYIASKEDVNSVSADIAETNAKLTNVETMVGIDRPTFTATSGYYISNSGVITSGGAFSYSEPIAVKAGDKIEFLATGYNTAVAMISLCDSDGTNIIPKVISVATADTEYEYDVEIDGHIVLSYQTAYKHILTITNDKVKSVEDTLSKVVELNTVVPQDLNVGFIHRDGRIQGGSNFRYTNPIRLENETIEFTARGYSDAVSLLSVCDVNGGNRKNVVNSTSDEETKTVKYTSNGATYIIICSNVAVPIYYKTTKIDLSFDEPYVNLSMFQKFGVIGDSFASGTLFFNSTSKDDYAHSWGQIMARRLGTVCTNYSKGGLSTRTWLTDAKGLPLLLASEPEEVYYLALGINDEYSLGADYLGSLVDITSHSSYEDYADSFYGNYGRIIEQIQEHAPHAKLVMFTLAHNFDALTRAYSAAIIEIAEHYNIPYINQRDDIFFNSSFFWDNMVEGHPIAIGYSGMASAFERLLNDCLKNNVNYFKDTFCYM